MKSITREWLKFAKKDIVSCERMIGDDFLTNIVAFHAQQAIEKSFKAIIEEHEIGFIKTHNLIRLLNLVEPHLLFEIDNEMLTIINELYIDSRYPGELGLLPEGNPTLEDAEIFYQFAKDIFNKTKNLLSNENT